VIDVVEGLVGGAVRNAWFRPVDRYARNAVTPHARAHIPEAAAFRRWRLSPKSTKASGLAERTMLPVHRVLSQAIDEAARQRLIPRNPVDDVKSPKTDAGTADETDKQRENLHPRSRPAWRAVARVKACAMFQLVVTAAGTGMRRGELLGLRWSDIAFDNNLIRVQRSV
jgi:integrase